MTLRFALPLVLAAMLAACSPRPVYNTEETPIPAQARTKSLAQIEEAIIDAGRPRGWTFVKSGPGHLLATYARNDWSATVNIVFGQTSYRITYASSVNLQKSDGSIHYNYNRWVNNLDQDIQLKLSQLGS